MNILKFSLSILTALQLSSQIQANPSPPTAEKIVDSLYEPVFLTAPANSTDALYILEKAGRIMIYDRENQKLITKPFLDIRNQINIKMNEQGLLGMAFSPNYAQDKRFYLYYTDTDGDTQISRFSLTDNAKKITEEKLLKIKQDFRNHNGGWLGFGPDGYLYIATGDGGSGNDPKQRAQDKKSLLGKILRIDVATDKGYLIPDSNPFISEVDSKDEIFSIGLRNPWRCSWDNEKLYIADVGQNHFEEINVVSLTQLNGANFGWRLREANHKTHKQNIGGEKSDTHIDPIFEYDHSVGKSITGGYVYYGTNKSIQGHYFYADWVKHKIWSFKLNGDKVTENRDWTNYFAQQGHPLTHISSFGKDPQGNIYIISHKGVIYKIK